MADYGKAEPLLRQAQEIRLQARGGNHPDYATSLHIWRRCITQSGSLRSLSCSTAEPCRSAGGLWGRTTPTMPKA